MLEKIYPLIIQHRQPPSLGSFPSLFKRRKKLLRKLPQHFFLFENQEFLYRCINHKNDHHSNSFLRVNSFKSSCQLEAWVGSPFGGEVRIIPFHNTPWRQPKIRITLGQLTSPSTCCGQVSAFTFSSVSMYRGKVILQQVDTSGNKYTMFSDLQVNITLLDLCCCSQLLNHSRDSQKEVLCGQFSYRRASQSNSFLLLFCLVLFLMQVTCVT